MAGGNTALGQAKKAKNDEFYTQWRDIEREVMAYLDYDPNVFRDKTVLLPCDDPEWSNFTKKYSKHKEVRGVGYLKYDNYAAIEVPFTDAIPSDYDGVMGVPISFLDKYCPEQFEIVGVFNHGSDHEYDLARAFVNGVEKFKRIAIRKRAGGGE